MKSRSDHKSRRPPPKRQRDIQNLIMKSEGVDLWEWAKNPQISRKRFDVVLESVGVIEKNSGLRKKYHLDIEIKKHTRSIFKKAPNPHFLPTSPPYL